MLVPHKGHTDTTQVYSVTVMTHVKALQAGHSSQGTSEPITPPAIVVITLPVRTYCSGCSFPEDMTVLGEVAEDLRAGGDIETPDSGVRRWRFGDSPSGSRRDKTVVGTLPGREITRGVGL